MLKSRLGLTDEEATVIENDTLAISRQQFREKLQQYEKAFTDALQQQPAISESDLNALRQNLQQILELRNEDTLPIEAQISASIEAYKQHLLQYEQALADAMRQEYPLSQITRRRFQQMQQEWLLIEADVAAIESRVSAEIEAYRQKLKQYEQTFTRVTRQEYPLSQNKRNELLQQQQNLGLHYQDIASIEARIIAEIEAYRQKLQQYEQAFITATQQEYPLSDAKRNELLQQRQILGLNQENIASIEARIIAEIEAYVPLQFVMFIAGLFGTLWMLYGGIFGNEENEPRIPTINNTPSVTLKPSVWPSQPSDRPDVVQTTTDLELFTNTSSPQQAIAPAGTVLKIIKSKVTTTQEQNSDESIFLRVCSVGEDITTPTNPPDPLTPITRKPKPVVKESKVYTIKLSEYQKLLNDSSTSSPEVIAECQQEPQPTPATTP